MSNLPQISGRDCVKALAKIGYYVKRQQGSHIVLRRDNPFGQLVGPIIRCWIEVLYARLFAKRDSGWMSLMTCFEGFTDVISGKFPACF